MAKTATSLSRAVNNICRLYVLGKAGKFQDYVTQSESQDCVAHKLYMCMLAIMKKRKIFVFKSSAVITYKVFLTIGLNE